MTDKKKFIFSNLLSLVLGIVIGAGGFGIVSNVNKPAKVPEQAVTLPDNGGTVIGEAQGNGVQMMKSVIPVEEYELYGVSTQAESAYTIIATITPDDASNKNVKWELSFKDSASSWAKGKKLSDYVTLSTSGAGNNAAVLSCVKAFGEQILLTATAEDDSTKSAVCTVDYAQKVIGATLSLGDIQCEENAYNPLPFLSKVDTRADYRKPVLTLQYSSVYTLEDSFSTTYEADYIKTSNTPIFKSSNFAKKFAFYLDCNASANLAFDLYLFNECEMFSNNNIYPMGSAGTTWNSSKGKDYIDEYILAINDELDETADDGDYSFPISVKATIEGKYSSYTYSTKLYFVSDSVYTEITDLTLDKNNVVFY